MSQTDTDKRGRRGGRRERDDVSPERQAEARRQLRVVGDPVLRETARPVTDFDDELAELSRRMIRVMHDAPGIGLAAPQVGVVRRVIVYHVDEQPVTLVNPEIVSTSVETEILDEGSLSVPGVSVPVERPAAIRVRAQGLHGERLEYDADDLEARVIQHETDHLNGVLILERTTRQERARALRELRDGAPAPTGTGL